MSRARSKRSRGLVVMYSALLGWTGYELVREIVTGDAWRSFGFAVAVLALVVIFDDMTREPRT